MNTATAVAFVVAAGFAVGDWTARARHNRRLEYVCKPATLVALIAAACLLDPAADAQTRRAWFVAALVASLAGDVLLMLERDLFVFGLGAFLVGHCFYVAGFWTTPPGGARDRRSRSSSWPRSSGRSPAASSARCTISPRSGRR